MNRINGKGFDVRLLGFPIHFESFTLTIEDESGVAMNNGVPDGNLPGNCKASGELVLDSQYFMQLTAAAAAAGSWQKIPPFVIDAYAQGENSKGAELSHVRAFGCKMRISDLLNIDSNSSDKSTHKIKFDVTDPDFVWINGVPYLDESEFNLF